MEIKRYEIEIHTPVSVEFKCPHCNYSNEKVCDDLDDAMTISGVYCDSCKEFSTVTEYSGE